MIALSQSDAQASEQYRRRLDERQRAIYAQQRALEATNRLAEAASSSSSARHKPQSPQSNDVDLKKIMALHEQDSGQNFGALSENDSKALAADIQQNLLASVPQASGSNSSSLSLSNSSAQNCVFCQKSMQKSSMNFHGDNADTIAQMPCCNLEVHYSCYQSMKDYGHGCIKNPSKNSEECVICNEDDIFQSEPKITLPCGGGKHFMCKKCYEGQKAGGCPMCREASNYHDRQADREQARQAIAEELASIAAQQKLLDEEENQPAGAQNATEPLVNYKKGTFLTTPQLLQAMREGRSLETIRLEADSALKAQIESWLFRGCVVCKKRMASLEHAKHVPGCKRFLEGQYTAQENNPLIHFVHEQCAQNMQGCDICQRDFSPFDRLVLEHGVERAVEIRSANNTELERKRNAAQIAQQEAQRQQEQQAEALRQNALQRQRDANRDNGNRRGNNVNMYGNAVSVFYEMNRRQDARHLQQNNQRYAQQAQPHVPAPPAPAGSLWYDRLRQLYDMATHPITKLAAVGSYLYITRKPAPESFAKNTLAPAVLSAYISAGSNGGIVKKSGTSLVSFAMLQMWLHGRPATESNIRAFIKKMSEQKKHNRSW